MKILLTSLLFLNLFYSGLANSYITCKCNNQDKAYVECSGKCPNGCSFESWYPGEHYSCENRNNSSRGPNCGTAWSDYKAPGESKGNPCPLGCDRGEPLEFRASLNPLPVESIKFQCYGNPVPQVVCGESWTGWYEVGAGVGNPCPNNCPIRGRELGKNYRSVGFPPRPQIQTKFQCIKQLVTCKNKEEIIRALYRQLLDRDPDEGGFNHHLSLLSSNQLNLREMFNGILHSQEYFEKFVSGKPNEVVVRGLYQRVLGRDPDESGFRHHLQGLSTIGFSATASNFVNSLEFTQKFGDWGMPVGNGKLGCDSLN